MKSLRAPHRLPILFVVAALLLCASSASAQEGRDGAESPAHAGFWLSGGIGAGTTDSDSDEDSGPAGYIRMGGTPSDRVLLGGELIGMTREIGGVDVSQGNATFSVLFYPSAPGGFFVKAGAGVASATVSSEVPGGTLTSDESGFGFTLGGGYDIRLGSNLYLTPNLDLLFQSFDEFADSNLFLLTVGLGFH